MNVQQHVLEIGSPRMTSIPLCVWLPQRGQNFHSPDHVGAHRDVDARLKVTLLSRGHAWLRYVVVFVCGLDDVHVVKNLESLASKEVGILTDVLRLDGRTVFIDTLADNLRISAVGRPNIGDLRG